MMPEMPERRLPRDSSVGAQVIDCLGCYGRSPSSLGYVNGLFTLSPHPARRERLGVYQP